MSFDYDLVVIGSSPEGIYAAHKAILLQARVALVTQQLEPDWEYQQLAYHHSLGEIANYSQRLNSNPWGIWTDNIETPPTSLVDIKSWGDLVQENITAEQSLDNLAVLGVDVIGGRGEFCRLPKQAFLVNNRQLRSRNYLLATGSKYYLPENCSSSLCFTPEDLWQQQLDDCPQDLAIIGDSSFCLELAQGLARLGKNISLLSPSPRLLETELVAASRLLQAQFTADRIRIFVDFVPQDLKIERVDQGKDKGKIKLCSRNQELVTSGVIVANCPQPNVEGLNLKAVKVKYFRQGVKVNEKLQTSNSTIYACGNLLGGNSHLARAHYEVDIALKNMFLLPIFKREYRYVPKAVFTQPQFSRIGITSKEALPKKLAAKKSSVYEITQHFKNILAAQLPGTTSGWGQFLISAKGEILGCTIIGDRSVEIISLVGLMMKHKIRLSANPMRGLLRQEIPYLSPSLSEILNQVQIAFHQQKINDQPKLQRRLKAWFERRR